MLLTGVYAIRNTVNDKHYIGSASVSLKTRWYAHKKMLRDRKHFNRHLQSAWDKYGEESFEFLVLLRIQPNRCLEIEQYYIDYHWCMKSCYNLSPTAGSQLGIKRSDETRARMSEAIKKSVTEESRRKTRERNRSRIVTDESRARMSASHKGKKHTEEHKAKLRGRKASAETRAKMSNSSKGHKRFTDDVKIRKSIATKKRLSENPDQLQAVVDRCRAMASEANKARWKKEKASKAAAFKSAKFVSIDWANGGIVEEVSYQKIKALLDGAAK